MSSQATVAHLPGGRIVDACSGETAKVADARDGTDSPSPISEFCAQVTTEPKDLQAQKAVEGRAPRMRVDRPEIS